MSDTTETTAVDTAAPDTVDTTVDTSTDTSSEAVEDTPAPVVEAKPEVPKKFLKPDGTPDYDRMAKSYTALEKQLSKKGNIPPASIEEYEWAGNDRLDLPEENVAAFKAEVFEKGFTKAQYEFIMDRYAGIVEGMTPSVEKAQEVLQAEWGDDFDSQVKAARTGFENFAPSDADPNDPVWNHPAVMKLLARMGGEVGEDSLTPVTRGPSAAAESIDQQIAELRSKPDWFTNPQIQKQLDALYLKREK